MLEKKKRTCIMPIHIAILTISDRAAAGTYEDRSGPALQALVERTLAATVVAKTIVPDDRARIAAQLRAWADEGDSITDIILTTGGTGFTPRDVTPEATHDVIEKEAPGLAEAMRAASLAITPHAILSRAVAGIRGQTLIINLPGSPKGATENLRTVLPALPHAVELLRNAPSGEAGHLRTSPTV
jgi:molybdopterin adenylyltransferase